MTPAEYQPHLAASQPLPVSAYHYYTPPIPQLQQQQDEDEEEDDEEEETRARSGRKIPLTPSKLPFDTLDLTEDDFYDYTDFVKDQDGWSIDNLPEILYQLRPTSTQWRRFGAQKQPLPTLRSPWKGEPALTRYPILPMRISSNVEIWRVEAWLRLDMRISLNDIVMRMNPRFRQMKSVMEENLAAFRRDFRITTWSRIPPSGTEEIEPPCDLDFIEGELMRKGISPLVNSTRGLTPGLIDVKLGEKGGRVAVPEKYSRVISAPKPITPRKGMGRFQLRSGCVTLTPVRRAKNVALLQRELSTSPLRARRTSIPPPSSNSIVVDSDSSEDGKVIYPDDRPSTPTPENATPTPVPSTPTSSAKTCKTTAIPFTARTKPNKDNSSKLSRGDTPAAKRLKQSPCSTAPSATTTTKSGSPLLGSPAPIRAVRGKHEMPQQPQPSPSLPLLKTQPPSLFSTPPPSYSNTADTTPVPQQLHLQPQPQPYAPITAPTLSPSPLAALRSSIAALKHAAMQDATNQQNWDELYAAIELLNRSKKELVDFAVEGLKVHRQALDEELEWLYERFGNEQGSASGGGGGNGNGKSGKEKRGKS